MKKSLILAFIACVLSVSVGYGQSATPKFGHVNTEELLQAMPESDSAQLELEADARALEENLEAMQVEYNQKLDTYLQEQDQYSDIIQETKETELQDLQQRIQQYSATAQQRLQRKRAQLFQPILDKAKQAIEEVAQEQNITYVFDTSSGALIYTADNSLNLLPMVKENLGLQ
jgi:outer membrane protein